MNILEHSYSIASTLLPKAKSNRSSKNKFFHFAFAYKKNKLIAMGQNNPDKTHTKALMLAKRFRTELDYPYLHAETDLISKLWGDYYIDDSMKFVIIRLNKHGKLRCSKPCEDCEQIINALGLTKVWWSTDNGFEKK